MTRRHPLLTLLVCVALAPITMASSCKDKDNTDQNGNGTGNGEGADGVGVESTLQVISIDPAGAEPNQSLSAQVFGSGFQADAEVYVGTVRIASVTRFDENTLQITVPPLETGNYDVKVRNPNGESSTLYGGLTVRVGASGQGGEAGAGSGASGADAGPTVPPGVDCGRVVVNFGFDAYTLSEGARSTLGAAMGCFRGAGGAVTIEGHCDERGTTDYNLALGQKRAESVRGYLTAQGVPSSQLRIVSYGEERPVDKGAGESAWARNRRAEVKAPR
ncbi:MAG: OmpA family protein [Deltaproteobacteria bacterium]|jgi:peptidoglycan-associated lipoprotein|nr:OmpA family protein [Deltaproteobacteria bacterium]